MLAFSAYTLSSSEPTYTTPFATAGEDETPAAGGVAPQLGAGAGVQRVHVAVVRADINHPIRHGGRGIHRAAGGVAPLQAEVPNIRDVKHLLTRVPALHVVPVKLGPAVVALARWLLARCHGHEART